MKTYVFDPQGPDRFSVAPSDMGQAALRVVLVSIVVLWSYFRSDGTIADKITTSAHFQFALLYLLISLTLLAWTRYASQRASASYHSIIATRVLSIFTDISAVSIYTALSGPEGIILYPIYITSSIGYGYRFGVRYLYLALVVSASSFSIVLRMNPFIADNTSLIVAFYLGIILVPLYAAMLLNKHQLVLDRLKEVNAARSRFIANMSHEFRTPLHAIISGADLLREESQTNVVSQQRGSSQKLQLISEAGEHLLSLVNRVLDVASAEAGFPIGRSVDIIELYAPILSALKICQASAEKKGIQFSWFFDIDVPVEIETSSEMLKEIVINTVGNAVKYTVEGYVQVNVSMAAKETDSWLRIEVIDTGIGISSKLIPNIFEPFTLGDDSASRRFPGTGLGLTLTKKYVDRLGGTISFNSSRSTGTQCTIELPLNIPSSGSAHTSNVDFKEIGCIVYAEDLAAAALLERRLPGASVAEMTNISESIKHVPRSIGLVVLFVEDESLQESWSCGLHVRYPGAMLALCGSTRVTSLEP
ncbi:MAG: HAMP domain-containing sensor histidine kinase, partial [Woeseia sp.]